MIKFFQKTIKTIKINKSTLYQIDGLIKKILTFIKEFDLVTNKTKLNIEIFQRIKKSTRRKH